METAARPEVAPPRGERGLKYGTAGNAAADWAVAPPRGERGLKYLILLWLAIA